MASAAQITANQANARRSTGPRTAEGKAASARNATSHGLSSADFVILAGQEEEFSNFIDALRNEIQPAGAIEHELFAQHAHAAWTLRRCRRAEVASQFHSVCKGSDPLLTADMADRLKRIDLYARRVERTYQRTLKELQALQTNRLSGELLDAGIDSIAELPPLVNPIHINRQRSANARAHAAVASADEKESFRLAAQTMADFRAQVADHYAGLHKQTQSPAQVAFAAGGQN